MGVGRPFEPKHTPQERAALREQAVVIYAEPGTTVADVAYDLGITRWVALSLLHEAGVVRPKGGHPRRLTT